MVKAVNPGALVPFYIDPLNPTPTVLNSKYTKGGTFIKASNRKLIPWVFWLRGQSSIPLIGSYYLINVDNGNIYGITNATISSRATTDYDYVWYYFLGDTDLPTSIPVGRYQIVVDVNTVGIYRSEIIEVCNFDLAETMVFAKGSCTDPDLTITAAPVTNQSLSNIRAQWKFATREQWTEATIGVNSFVISFPAMFPPGDYIQIRYTAIAADGSVFDYRLSLFYTDNEFCDTAFLVLVSNNTLYGTPNRYYLEWYNDSNDWGDINYQAINFKQRFYFDGYFDNPLSEIAQTVLTDNQGNEIPSTTDTKERTRLQLANVPKVCSYALSGAVSHEKIFLHSINHRQTAQDLSNARFNISFEELNSRYIRGLSSWIEEKHFQISLPDNRSIIS